MNRFIKLLATAALVMVSGLTARGQINLNLKDVTLKEAIAELSRTNNISIVVSPGDVDLDRKVVVSASNASLEDVLVRLFAGQEVSWKIDGRNVSVVRKEREEKAAPAPAPAQKTVFGKVVDASGEPVIGAGLKVEGTRAGFISGIDGSFEIKGVRFPAILLVSSMGYEDRTIEVTGKEKSPVVIVLEDSRTTLDEIVVVGYGTQKRSSLSGAVATIDGKTLNERPVLSAANALQGADPSLNLTFGTGGPAADYNINIRGALSIKSSDPLILADGVRVSLKQINPNDIESVSVLKDASSCAIYGAEASAGVVLITTKQGKRGDNARITYNFRQGWQRNTTTTDFITTGYDAVTICNAFINNSPQAASVHNALNYTEANGGLQKLYERRGDKTEDPSRPWIEQSVVNGKNSWMYYANFDWYDFLFNKVRPQQEHNLSLSGGSDKISYYVSGRYLNQDGIFKVHKDNYQDLSVREKFSIRLRKWFKFSSNISYDKNSYVYGGFPNIEKTYTFLHKNVVPCFVPRNLDGTLIVYPVQNTQTYYLGVGGIVGYLTSGVSSNNRTNRYLTIASQGDFYIGDHLSLTLSYDYRNRNRLYRYRHNDFEYSRYVDVIETFVGPANNTLSYYEEHSFSYDGNNWNAYATYDNHWGRHFFKAVAGGQYQSYHSTTFTCEQADLISDSLDSFAVGTGTPVISQALTGYKTLGFFGRINYDWANRYILEISARADGSSRFAKGSRWAFFPSGSAAWRFSDEAFFAPLKKVIDSGKIRFSMGSLGNQQVDNYAYFETISPDVAMNYTFDNNALAYQANISAPISSGLTWEMVTTYDAGLDFTFLGDRLNLTADAYIRDTKNMLTTSLTLPNVYGAATPQANCANLRTKGWELVVNWRDRFNLAGSPFGYSVGASLGDYRTRITKYHNPDKLLSDYYEGMTLGEIWGFHVSGLYLNDVEAAIDDAEIKNDVANYRIHKSSDSESGPRLRAGDVKYEDVNGDKQVSRGANTFSNHGDMSIIGNSLPRYSYSLTLGFDWKGIDFSAFFQGVGHRDWYPEGGSDTAYEFWVNYASLYPSFIPVDFMKDVWTEENPNAYFPRIRGYAANTSGQLGVINDRYIQNVAYLRLKNLTVGYSLPKRLVRKVGMEGVRFYFTGENLFYISPLRKYCKTVDPENAGATGALNGASGIGTSWTGGSGTAYPYSSVFSVGVDVKF